jgi:hypothetical protein
MDPLELAQTYPRVYHVALARNQRLIARHGLRSTATLLNLAEPAQASRRRSLESARRATLAELPLADGTKAYLRDHLPINDKQLRRLLEPGTTLEDWYCLLNSRLFFWLALDTAMEFAASYVDHDQVLFAFDTARLLAAPGLRVSLSEVNSGTTAGKVPRGQSTFVPLAEAKAGKKFVELTVDGEIPDAMAACVERWTVIEGKPVSKVAPEPS